ncbi:MAG: inositol monophosphatase family protein [Acetobacteraceae bacterium]
MPSEPPLTVTSKDDASPVTQVDHEVETLLRGPIQSTHPTHHILGEEFGGHPTTDRWQWVIDPIDGTRAFITGRPSFTTLIAVLRDGAPYAGLIDQPITGERWFGVTGAETQFTSVEIPGQVGTRRATASLADAELSCTAPDMHIGKDASRFAQLQRHVRRTNWGDAYAYGLLSLGLIDIIAESTMKIWDWAALVPIVEGAGGCITDWQDRSLTAESDGTVLACASPSLNREACAALNAPF